MQLDTWLKMKTVDAKAFAQRLGINEASLWRIRRRRLRPSWPTILAILRETDGAVTPNDFIELEPEPEKAAEVS